MAGLSVVYRKQLANFVDIWKETFPAERSIGDSNRGKIYDRNFKELARTLERVSIYVRPREVKDIPETARLLAAGLDLPESESITRMERDSQLVWLRRDIGQREEDIVAELALPGIYLHRELARDYPQKEFASQLIGYAENDSGLTGVEHYYNRLLTQERVRQEDFPRIDLKGLSHTGSGGHDLVLTLDMKIQRSLESYVKNLGEGRAGRRIATLLLDTRQGNIVAGASYPSHDPNSVRQRGNDNRENLLLTPMVIPDEIRGFLRDASLLQGAWEQSAQVYPWSLVSSTVNMASQFRLWERLGLTTDIRVDFSGAKKRVSCLPRFEGTSPPKDFGSVPRTAPSIKVLLAMTGLLNGGKKVQPHILDRILERPDLVEYFYDGLPKGSGPNVYPSGASKELQSLFMKQATAGVLNSGMLGGGSVSLVQTGSGGRYVHDQMAVVSLPATVPQMLLLIVARDDTLLVEQKAHPGNRGFKDGLDAILPSMVALQQVYQNLADMVEPSTLEDQNFHANSGMVQEAVGQPETQLESIVAIMPDLCGLSLRKSLRVLQPTGLEIALEGSGRVVSQVPEAGTKIQRGGSCQLFLRSAATPQRALE
jgi:cell division protein FtsI (penicillin-binding protein 3)